MSSQASSSFYKPAVQYKNKKMFYHIIKMNMQEIQRLACEVDENVKKVRKDIDITAGLLNAIQMHEENQN